jgi:hypothetical protein
MVKALALILATLLLIAQASIYDQYLDEAKKIAQAMTL